MNYAEGTKKMKLLTRRQIIEEWKKQPDEMLDTLCCPQYRNLLH